MEHLTVSALATVATEAGKARPVSGVNGTGSMAPGAASVDDEWQELWNARVAALEPVLGPADDAVFHAPVPFHLGGAADMLTFREHVQGVVYVTADLIGDDRSMPSELGQYELMICLRQEADWAPQLIGNLAKYTIEALLKPYATMDIGPALPKPTELVAFIYLPYANLTVADKEAGLLLCLGITVDELSFAREHGPDDLVARLEQAGVYPFTALSRRSVLRSP